MQFDMSLFPRLLLAFALLGAVCCLEGDYSYNDLKGWGRLAPICNSGKRQSPIELRARLKNIRYDESPIQFVNYHLRPVSLQILNDGHTANHTIVWSDEYPYITGELLNWERYKFLDLHAHWGTHNNTGTEHSIHGVRYASELHLVHINAKYADLDEALHHEDGVLVLGILFEITRSKHPNMGMYLLSALDSTVSEVNTSVNSTVFDFSLLKLDTIESFYYYLGSLTTPPCTENVRWVIASDIFPINEASVEALRAINLGDQEVTNVRPVQPLHDRTVEHYQPRRANRRQPKPVAAASLFVRD